MSNAHEQDPVATAASVGVLHEGQVAQDGGRLTISDERYRELMRRPAGLVHQTVHFYRTTFAELLALREIVRRPVVVAAPELLAAAEAAANDLETYEREIRALAPEAFAPSLPMLLAAIARAQPCGHDPMKPGCTLRHSGFSDGRTICTVCNGVFYLPITHAETAP